MKNLLSAEQSATLIAKGISADKASEIAEYDDEVSQWTHRGTPIFTLADLFALIPKTIPDDDDKPYGYHRFGIAIDHKMLWCVSYFGNCYRHIGFDNVELIDSLYQLVGWLADNKLIDLTE